MTPYHAVYRGVTVLCEGIGNVTDVVDGDLTSIEKEPLIYIGESNVEESGSGDLYGSVSQTIHIYGHMRDRKKTDETFVKIRDGLIGGIEEYSYRLTLPRVSFRVLQDTSTEKKLLHYILEYRVNYSK